MMQGMEDPGQGFRAGKIQRAGMDSSENPGWHRGPEGALEFWPRGENQAGLRWEAPETSGD